MAEKLVVGIDEAGRGPVIGPMVLCAVGVPKLRHPLFALPLRDSKKLTPRGREVLFFPILETATQVVVESVPPGTIDRMSLTALWMEFVLKVARQLSVRKLILDAPVSERALRATKSSLSYLLKKRQAQCTLVLEHRADENYPLVSAASIVAKVCRDAHIQCLQRKYGDFGSGYPSDPKTRRFLQKAKDLPMVRKRWKIKW